MILIRSAVYVGWGVCGRWWGVEMKENKDCGSGRLNGIIDGALQARKDPPRTHWMAAQLNVTLWDGIRLSGRCCRFTRQLRGDDEEDELLSFHCELPLSALQAVNFRTARQHWTTAVVAKRKRAGWNASSSSGNWAYIRKWNVVTFFFFFFL